jgi:hypothetical protein
MEQPTQVQITRPVFTSRSWIMGLTSFCFILLQSACTAFMAISSLRLLIGVGSLAAATTGLNLLDAIHGAALRIPMVVLALVGSVINLLAIWRLRSLRLRPASQWRIAPVTPAKKRAEFIQITLAVLTLLFVALETSTHLRLFGDLLR